MLVILFAIISVTLGIIVVKVKKFLKLSASVRELGGPTTAPILGNAHQIGFTPREYLESMFKWWKEYGPKPYSIWLMDQLFVIVSDPKDVEVVLSTSPPMRKADIYDLMRPWLGDGLLTSFGTKWFKHRKVITPSFHFSILVDFFEIMNEKSNDFMKQLNEKAKSGEIFDIQSMVHYCTLDIICETAMGVDLNSMKNPKSDVVGAFQDICYLVQSRIYKPLQYNDFLYMLTADYRKQKKALNILKDFTSNIIRRRQKALNETDQAMNGGDHFEVDGKRSKKKAFLDTLLTSTIDALPLSFQDVFEEVSTFMFEGHDTTTSGITFAIYLLSRHPQIQEKVFEEQKLIFGNDLRRDATYQETTDMKYLELVIKESQRLYPSVPMVGRQVTEKFNLNGKEFMPGTIITLFLMAMGYNENYFPDPLKFNPDRFDVTKREKFHPFEYVPFSAGPRNCIGQKFAVLEMKCVLSKIIRHFELLPPLDGLPFPGGYNPNEPPKNQYEPILSAMLTLKSDTGVAIRLRSREN